MRMKILNKARTIMDVPASERELAIGLLLGRIALAIFFVTHGFAKLTGIDGFVGLLTNNGFPLPVLLAWLVAIAEFFGGLGILLGIATRFSAFWLAIVALVAWAIIKDFSLGMGVSGGDVDILAFGLALLLLYTGPGAISISAKRKRP